MVPPHPYGVQPWGQAYLQECVGDIRPTSLGRLAALSDELLLSVLYALPAADLQRLGCASKALYVFAHHDELWKALMLEVRPRACVLLLAWGCMQSHQGSLLICLPTSHASHPHIRVMKVGCSRGMAAGATRT